MALKHLFRTAEKKEGNPVEKGGFQSPGLGSFKRKRRKNEGGGHLTHRAAEKKRSSIDVGRQLGKGAADSRLPSGYSILERGKTGGSSRGLSRTVDEGAGKWERKGNR